MLSVLAQIGLKSQLQGTPSVVNHGKELHPNVHSLFSTKNIKEIDSTPVVPEVNPVSSVAPTVEVAPVAPPPPVVNTPLDVLSQIASQKKQQTGTTEAEVNASVNPLLSLFGGQIKMNS